MDNIRELMTVADLKAMDPAGKTAELVRMETIQEFLPDATADETMLLWRRRVTPIQAVREHFEGRIAKLEAELAEARLALLNIRGRPVHGKNGGCQSEAPPRVSGNLNA